jgi:hypothetical protein
MKERPGTKINWKALLLELIKIVIGFAAGTQVEL